MEGSAGAALTWRQVDQKHNICLDDTSREIGGRGEDEAEGSTQAKWPLMIEGNADKVTKDFCKLLRAGCCLICGTTRPQR